MMKKNWLGTVLLVLCLLSLPVSGAFGPVDSSYQYNNGTYRYSYTITSTTAASVNWFSVALGGNPGLTGGIGQSGAFMWVPMVNAGVVKSVDAFFYFQNPGTYTMYFDSVHAPTQGKAMVTGMTGGEHYAMTGDVWTPAPEPTTMALFAIGMGLIARRKRA